jgi:hypothetical protein
LGSLVGEHTGESFTTLRTWKLAQLFLLRDSVQHKGLLSEHYSFIRQHFGDKARAPAVNVNHKPTTYADLGLNQDDEDFEEQYINKVIFGMQGCDYKAAIYKEAKRKGII